MNNLISMIYILLTLVLLTGLSMWETRDKDYKSSPLEKSVIAIILIACSVNHSYSDEIMCMGEEDDVSENSEETEEGRGTYITERFPDDSLPQLYRSSLMEESQIATKQSKHFNEFSIRHRNPYNEADLSPIVCYKLNKLKLNHSFGTCTHSYDNKDFPTFVKVFDNFLQIRIHILRDKYHFDFISHYNKELIRCAQELIEMPSKDEEGRFAQLNHLKLWVESAEKEHLRPTYTKTTIPNRQYWPGLSVSPFRIHTEDPSPISLSNIGIFVGFVGLGYYICDSQIK